VTKPADIVSELNEIATVILCLQAHIRMASEMGTEQPKMALNDVKIAMEVCGRIYDRLNKLLRDT
jgi:hypothetical protein